MATVAALSDIQKIRKRNGSQVPFDPAKITAAVAKALAATNTTLRSPEQITENVVGRLRESGFHESMAPGVEAVQDMVETVLIDMGCGDAAKSYILYRNSHKQLREKNVACLRRTRLMTCPRTLISIPCAC